MQIPCTELAHILWQSMILQEICYNENKLPNSVSKVLPWIIAKQIYFFLNCNDLIMQKKKKKKEYFKVFEEEWLKIDNICGVIFWHELQKTK